MDTDSTPDARIALLTHQLSEARREKDEALELVQTMREHLQESSDLIDQWIEVFDMQQDERGVWIFDRNASLFEEYKTLLDEHRSLLAEWNKFVPRYNATVAPQNIGRPLAASEAQVAEVKRLRKTGQSLREVVKATGLSMRTVRTILDKDEGKGRAAAKAHELRRKEFGRLRAAAFRARKRKLDALPKEIARVQADAKRLAKAAKGLHGRTG